MNIFEKVALRHSIAYTLTRMDKNIDMRIKYRWNIPSALFRKYADNVNWLARIDREINDWFQSR